MWTDARFFGSDHPILCSNAIGNNAKVQSETACSEADSNWYAGMIVCVLQHLFLGQSEKMTRDLVLTCTRCLCGCSVATVHDLESRWVVPVGAGVVVEDGSVG